MVWGVSGKRAGVVRYQVTVRLTSGDVRRWAGDGQADVFRFIRFMGRVIRIIGCRQESGGLHGGFGATSGPSFVVRRRREIRQGQAFAIPCRWKRVHAFARSYPQQGKVARRARLATNA
ncbi:hypothetical protein Dvul_3088 (plasmid) [Nitratidesulfovibrio vulgaris DP4]|uniref:Uncharacterized protein n=1 Tax=Nitratidesulfovibrio vulgaris (strain DP4) TaxID=391774 RepID=A0A0H3ACP4_NITV4|nr:hypothetical protein Dvul_3088 [Nitratidesulfovibrio vulgaris DP4]